MYRIFKEHRKNFYDGVIEVRFVIQVWKPKRLFRKEGWYDMTRLECYGGDCVPRRIDFPTQEQACEYLDFLNSETPKNDIVTCSL